MSADVLKAIESWRARLLDISKRNRLINCRTGTKTGMIVLEHPGMRSVWGKLVLNSTSMEFPWKHELLGDNDDNDTGNTDATENVSGTSDEESRRSGTVTDGNEADRYAACLPLLGESDILTTLSDKTMAGRLRRLSLNAAASLAEQGVQSLFVAFGLLRWYESKDSDEALQSPLLLVPVNLTRSSLDSAWQLRLAEEEVVPNHCLAQMLSENFQLQLPDAAEDVLLETATGLEEYLGQVRDAVSDHERWSVQDTAILGIFTFQKIAMWKDLGDNQDKLAAHPLCLGLADGTAHPPAERCSVPTARELDDLVPPQDTHHILEADSSQHEAIEAAKRGVSFVLDGPPGTGKSQTIANIIAECLAQGKSILFVSEKSAALEVVKRRLDAQQLGDFCLECHSHKANKKQVVAELGRCVRLSPEPCQSDDGCLEELRNVRQQLNAYARSLHQPKGKLGLTPYEVHGRLAALAPKSVSRCPVLEPLAADAAKLQMMRDALARLAECSPVIAAKGCHPWRGCTCTARSLVVEDDIRHHLDVLISQVSPYLAAFHDLQELGLVTKNPSMRDLEYGFDLARAAVGYPAVPMQWFDEDVRLVAQAYLKLDDLAKDYQRTRRTLSRYTEAALDGDWGRWHNALATDSAYIQSLESRSTSSLRVCTTRYEQMLPKLQELMAASAAVRAASSQVAMYLGSPKAAALPIHLVPQLCEAAELVVTTRLWPIPSAAGAYVTLNRLAQEYQRQRQAIPEYADGSLDGDWDGWTRTLATESEYVHSLQAQPTGSARVYAQRCGEMLAALHDLIPTSEAVSAAASQVATCLCSPKAATLAFHLLPKLCEATELIARTGKLRLSWADRLRRQEFKRIVDTECREADSITEERAQLSAIYVAGAFDEAVVALLVDALRYGSFLHRLILRWRSVRRQVASLYIGAPPVASSALLQDVTRLLQYHRRRARLLDIGKSLGDQVRASAQGTVDWAAVRADLELIDRIQATVLLPDSAWVALCSEGFDRDALAVSAEQLRDRHRKLINAIAHFEQRFGVDLVQAAGANGRTLAVDGIAQWIDWLRNAKQDLSERVTVLSEIVTVISPDKDVDISEYPQHAVALQDLRQKRDSVRAARTTLCCLGETSASPENADWDEEADLAQRLLELAGSVLLEAGSKSSLVDSDRDALATSARELRERHHKLIEAITHFDQCFGVDLVQAAGANSGTPTADVARWTEWLKDAAQAASEHTKVLSQMVAVLAPEQDVNVSECRRDAPTWITLQEKRRELCATYDKLRSVGEVDGSPENADWSANASLAQWVLKFVSQHGYPLPCPLVAAVSDSTARSRIADATTTITALRRPDLLASWEYLCTIFPAEEEVSEGIVLNRARVEQLTAWLAARANDVTRIGEWITFGEVSRQLDQLGLGPVRQEVLSHAVSVEDAVDAFLVRFYRVWLDAAYANAPSLHRFAVESHETLIQRFRELDRQHIKGSFRRIRALRLAGALGQGTHEFNAPESSELGILLREVNKRRRHLPLRQLFSRIPTLLRRLKPCLMMSPLAVSTFLDSAELQFDVVIFDEASQVRPHDAVCAIYRGAQLLVAGDQKQLPPTSFFERQSETLDGTEEDEQEGIADFESILDVCATLGLPRKRLQWHYRSRRESLIAFSNHNFYDGELVTFPSAWDIDEGSAVRFEFVRNGRWQSGSSGGFNQAEAEQTADMVLEHARLHGNVSLGVITMNQRQQLLVLEEVEKRRRNSPELEQFFGDEREEPFFVKNLENVQGDERDVIFLSVCYGPDQSGNLAMRFGPLNLEGGERRLNVAVTRARQSLALISSIRATDIDISRTNALGAKLLRAYLDYSERGPQVLSALLHEDGRAADSPFEEQVAKALRAEGFQIRLQVGCGKFRIDLALVDPEHPGRYVLGVECDGATYHNSATARDRDRLRQSVLEGMGWRITRVWSTDWVRDPARQVKRVSDAYLRALTNPMPEGPAPHGPTESESPEPKAKVAAAATMPQHNFSSIEDVPQLTIEAIALRIVEVSGATDRRELIVAVARRLGFDRTGSRISKRVAAAVRAMLRNGVLVKSADDRIAIPSP